MSNKIDYTLYLVTDTSLMSTATIEEAVEAAIIGGCTLVQLREKRASSREFYSTAVRVKRITDSHDVPLIINDRVDIAMAVNAAGVHLGQGDLPAKIARKLIGTGKLLGVSASCLHEAKEAFEDGADYLGIGALFSTDTKTDAELTTMEQLSNIRKAIDLPIVVIGGINKSTIPLLAGTGVDGLSVVSAIISEKDITNAAAEIKKLFLSTINI